jgi:hypothetical protein
MLIVQAYVVLQMPSCSVRRRCFDRLKREHIDSCLPGRLPHSLHPSFHSSGKLLQTNSTDKLYDDLSKLSLTPFGMDKSEHF